MYKPNRGKVVWLMGLSGSGKSSICLELANEFRYRSIPFQILDGDSVRLTLFPDLGFSLFDRTENVRRIALIAAMLVQHGITVLVAAITPLESMRKLARECIPDLIEVFVSAPLNICELRDPKGLYRQARAGLISQVTGIDSPFEVPLDPGLVCDTHNESISQSANKVLKLLLDLDYHGSLALGDYPGSIV